MFKKIILLSTLVLTLAAPTFVLADHHKKSCDRGEKGDCASKKDCASESKLPCPMVALEKSKELGLSTKQIKDLTKIKNNVMKTAMNLEGKIKKANEALVNDVLSGKLDGDDLAKRVQSVAALQGDLRLLKMQTHINTMKILTPEQLEQLTSGGCDRKSGKKDCKKPCCNKDKAEKGCKKDCTKPCCNKDKKAVKAEPKKKSCH